MLREDAKPNKATRNHHVNHSPSSTFALGNPYCPLLSADHLFVSISRFSIAQVNNPAIDAFYTQAFGAKYTAAVTATRKPSRRRQAALNAGGEDLLTEAVQVCLNEVTQVCMRERAARHGVQLIFGGVFLIAGLL